MKADQLVKAILQDDLIRGAEATFEPDEVQDTLFALNNYMFELAADGVTLGFTELTNLGDEVTVPRGAINGIIKNVALYIAPQFGKQPTPEQLRQAAAGLQVMTKLAVTIPLPVYPDTLPIGTGNECGIDVHFYGESPDTVTTEQGVVISPESNTELP